MAQSNEVHQEIRQAYDHVQSLHKIANAANLERDKALWEYYRLLASAGLTEADVIPLEATVKV